MEKPRATCARCGGSLQQAATGRPRVYCSALCRRDAEYRLRRVQSHLARAERNLTTARLQAATADYDGYRDRQGEAEKRVKFWAAEVEQLSSELRAALADLSADDDDQGDAGTTPRLRAAG